MEKKNIFLNQNIFSSYLLFIFFTWKWIPFSTWIPPFAISQIFILCKASLMLLSALFTFFSMKYIWKLREIEMVQFVAFNICSFTLYAASTFYSSVSMWYAIIQHSAVTSSYDAAMHKWKSNMYYVICTFGDMFIRAHEIWFCVWLRFTNYENGLRYSTFYLCLFASLSSKRCAVGKDVEKKNKRDMNREWILIFTAIMLEKKNICRVLWLARGKGKNCHIDLAPLIW